MGLRRPSLVVLAAGLAVTAGLADLGAAKDPVPPRDISSVLAPILEKHGVPALGGAIVDTRRTVALGVSGVRVHGGKTAVTPRDLWHIGSDTKAITATLLARLHEQKKLTFDTELTAVFPRVKFAEGWKGATMHRLLGNRAGVGADLTQLPVWLQLWSHKGTPQKARRLLLADLAKRPPEAAPGTDNLYSNAGFALAGHAAEVRAKLDYESLVQREVFKPLGITTAGFGPPGKKTKPAAPDQPWGHAAQGETWRPMPPNVPGADNPTAIAPAGRVHLSLEDWGRFCAAHLRGAQGDVEGFLSKETFNTLHTPLPGQSYALGWMVTTQSWAGADGKPGPVLTHNGSNTMWYASAWLAPERGLAFLAVANARGEAGPKACNDVILALVAEADGLQDDAPAAERIADRAGADRWFQGYYLDPEPQRVEEYLRFVDGDGLLKRQGAQVVITSFLAEIFRANPDRIADWSERLGDTSLNCRRVVVSALWMAQVDELETRLRAAAGPDGDDTMLAPLLTTSPPADEDIPITSPSVLDMFWGMFMASGDAQHVRRIIKVLQWSEDESDTARLLIGGAARWSLTSNAVEHDRVLEICRAALEDQTARAAAVLAEVIQKAEEKRAAK